MYAFDKEGRIIEQKKFYRIPLSWESFHFDSLGIRTKLTRYKGYGSNQGISTYHFDTRADSSLAKENSITKIMGADSVVTTISFLKFKHGFDTAIVSAETYDKQRRLIRKQSAVNKRNEREVDDDTGSSTFDYYFGYDDNGRLNYFREAGSFGYATITYPGTGRIIEWFSEATHKLKERITRTCIEKKGVIIINENGKQVMLTLLDKGSKLYKLKTVLEISEVPHVYYHEIVYKYR